MDFVCNVSYSSTRANEQCNEDLNNNNYCESVREGHEDYLVATDLEQKDKKIEVTTLWTKY